MEYEHGLENNCLLYSDIVHAVSFSTLRRKVVPPSSE